MLKISKQVSLKKFNTFGIEAVAENLIEISNNQEIKEAITWGQERGYQPVILGGGSNVLFTQDSYPFILVNQLLGIEIVDESEDFVWVKSGAGEIWHELVLYCINKGWGGIENLSLIPGTVGAAPMQNIGAYGVEIKEVFESLEAIDLATFETRNFNKDECEFGYRESVFKKGLKGKYFISSVVLKLSKKPETNISYGAIKEVLEQKTIEQPSIKHVSDSVIQIRQSKLPDPNEIGNAGSFFKNPVITEDQFATLKQHYPEVPNYPQTNGQIKIPAGWLIEMCGWKGKREGNIGVHKNQALVLVNYGGGQGEEIKELTIRIRASVMKKFNIEITPEVNIL